MPRSLAFLLTLATLSATAVTSHAQSADPAGPSQNYLQSQPAPIEHNYAAGPSYANGPAYDNGYANSYGNNSYGNPDGQPQQHAPGPPPPRPNIPSSRPLPGVLVRTSPDGSVKTVSSGTNTTELRLEKGVANISVHSPEPGAQILVDLPGGQVSLLKDGFYSFNAATNTVRTFKGEAEAFPGNGEKGAKVKEEHQFVFAPGAVHAAEFQPEDARADLLPNPDDGRRPDRNPYEEGFYGAGPYGDGFGYGYGYPYAYGYGFGYPYGIGLGFGYYGGFYGGGFGGFRGGYGGGFHGGGFRR